MDYYKLADGTLVGTQADARASKQKWEPHAVPTDKQGLMDYLNRLVGARKQAASDDSGSGGSGDTAPPPPIAPPAAPKPLPQDRTARLIALEEAIQDATGFELSNLIGNVMSRLEELRQEAKVA